MLISKYLSFFLFEVCNLVHTYNTNFYSFFLWRDKKKKDKHGCIVNIEIVCEILNLDIC